MIFLVLQKNKIFFFFTMSTKLQKNQFRNGVKFEFRLWNPIVYFLMTGVLRRNEKFPIFCNSS